MVAYYICRFFIGTDDIEYEPGIGTFYCDISGCS